MLSFALALLVLSLAFTFYDQWVNSFSEGYSVADGDFVFLL